MTSAIRMARQREARKASGKTEIRCWLSQERVACMDDLCQRHGLSRAEVISAAIWDLYARAPKPEYPQD